MLEEALQGEPRIADLERTVAEQSKRLEALDDEIRFMVDRQAELRTMLHAAHGQLLDAQEQLEASVTQETRQHIANLERELSLTRQHAQNLEAALVQAQDRASDLEGQFGWHREAAQQWEARTLDLERRLARVRNSPAGRVYGYFRRMFYE